MKFTFRIYLTLVNHDSNGDIAKLLKQTEITMVTKNGERHSFISLDKLINLQSITADPKTLRKSDWIVRASWYQVRKKLFFSLHKVVADIETGKSNNRVHRRGKDNINLQNHKTPISYKNLGK